MISELKQELKEEFSRLLDNTNKPLIVIELKKNNTAESAIAQIKEKKYTESFEKYTGEILLVGITYDDDKKHY